MPGRISQIEDLGTILGIWAHPDDETWACAGVMSRAIGNGQKVACIMATKGGSGKTADAKKWPKINLDRIRETELGKALRIIGVHDLYWLGYNDGHLAEADSSKAVAKLTALIDKIAPDTIITFEPKGITGHQDHKTVCAWTCSAVKKTGCRPVVYGACETKERYISAGRDCHDQFGIYFRAAKPFNLPEKHGDLLLKLSRAEARQKMAALKAHESQTAGFFEAPIGRKYLKKLCAVECFVKLVEK